MVKILDRIFDRLEAPEADKPSLLDRANDPSIPLARGLEKPFDSRTAEQIAKDKAAAMVAAAALRGASSESDTPVPASPEVVDFAAQNGEPSVAPVELPQLPPTEEPRQQ